MGHPQPSKERNDSALRLVWMFGIIPLSRRRISTDGLIRTSNPDSDETRIVPMTGIIADTAFRKTTTPILVLGPNRGPSKIQKAKECDIPCVSVEVFVDELTH